ncbi:mechanosensitive ion channel [Plantactinospora veratri]
MGRAAVIVRAVLILVAVAGGAFVLSLLLGRALRPIGRGHRLRNFLQTAQVRGQRAFSVLSMALAVYYALPATGLPAETLEHLRHWDLLVAIGTAGWLTTKVLHVVEESIYRRHPRTPTDERVRRTHTQVRVVRRATVALVVLLTIGTMLLTFRPVRVLGLSLLASAGVFGLVIGVATRPMISAAMASIQMAFTDALHIDDVVVVDGQWGQVEEVQLTHVVIRTWDERQLILPSTYFVSKPFENWTRFGARVAAAVDLVLDYTADLEELRAEVGRQLATSSLWDRAGWGLQMTDMSEQHVTVRITVTAEDGPSAWNLRCELREGLVRFLRDHHPQWMPRRPHYEA